MMVAAANTNLKKNKIAIMSFLISAKSELSGMNKTSLSAADNENILKIMLQELHIIIHFIDFLR